MRHARVALSCVFAALALSASVPGAEVPGHWRLSVSDVKVSEESCAPHQAVFAVRLFKHAYLPIQVVTVEYATADGTAVAGVDYTAASGTLTFTPADDLLTVAVPITDALVPGPDKAFTLNLSNASGAIIAKPTGTATLLAPTVARCASCALSCDDGEACTADSCSASLGCRNVDVNACATAACELGACALDSDGDGLSDAWERNGYVDLDCNGQYDGPATDVPLPGADPSSPDIYVKYDYMVAPAHDHRPSPAALGQVEAAFAARGVALHFAAPSAGIHERKVTTLDPAPSVACAGDDFVTMPKLRAANLGNLAPAYHYMVFAHRVTCPDLAHCVVCPNDAICGGLPEPTSTGSADLPGDDSIVAFGSYVDAGVPVGIETLAATTMHELGHNLGLKHGGDVSCVNQKPHYLSVMNYTYQLNGILVAEAPGSTTFLTCVTEAECGPPIVTSGTCATPSACHCTDDLAPVLGTDICYRIDYSDLLPFLNESVPVPGVGGLDEGVGVSGPPWDDDLVLFWAPGPVQLLGASNGAPIDWDDSGGIETHVQADINNDVSYTLLSTQDDWETSGGLFTHLAFAFQCTAGAGEAGEWTTNEMSRDYALRHRLAAGWPRAPRNPKE